MLHSLYQADTGGMGRPSRSHVTRGVGLPWASHGRMTSDPASTAIFTVVSWSLLPSRVGFAVNERAQFTARDQEQVLSFLLSAGIPPPLQPYC